MSNTESKLKKISAYVPEELYECLEKDKEEAKISLSQVIIAALANHYNIEVTVGKSGRRVTLGGETATVQRVEALENKFAEFSSNITEQIEQVLSAIQSNKKSTNGKVVNHKQTVKEASRVKNESIDKFLTNSVIEYEGNQLSCLPIESAKTEQELQITPLTGRLLGKRLKVGKDTPAQQKRKKSSEEFCKWSIQKDLDDIGWIPNPDGTGYIPSKEITQEQLKILEEWIKNNE